MHNEEGKLFDAVFHKLLALGMAVIALALVVWLVWTIARTSAITHDASQSEAAHGASSALPPPAPVPPAPLASVRAGPASVHAPPGAMIRMLIRPMASATAWLERLSRALTFTVADAVFFAGGP